MSPTGLRRLLLVGALAAAAGLGACVAYPGDYGYDGYGDSYAYNDYGYGYSRPSYGYPSGYYSRGYSSPRYYSSRRSYYDNDRRSYRRSYSRRNDGWRDGDRSRYVRRIRPPLTQWRQRAPPLRSRFVEPRRFPKSVLLLSAGTRERPLTGRQAVQFVRRSSPGPPRPAAARRR